MTEQQTAAIRVIIEAIEAGNSAIAQQDEEGPDGFIRRSCQTRLEVIFELESITAPDGTVITPIGNQVDARANRLRDQLQVLVRNGINNGSLTLAGLNPPIPLGTARVEVLP